MVPAVQAGVPVAEKEYEKSEVSGVKIYIRKDMLDKKYAINWIGLWIFGRFEVREI